MCGSFSNVNQDYALKIPLDSIKCPNLHWKKIFFDLPA